MGSNFWKTIFRCRYIVNIRRNLFQFQMLAPSMNLFKIVRYYLGVRKLRLPWKTLPTLFLRKYLWLLLFTWNGFASNAGISFWMKLIDLKLLDGNVVLIPYSHMNPVISISFVVCQTGPGKVFSASAGSWSPAVFKIFQKVSRGIVINVCAVLIGC